MIVVYTPVYNGEQTLRSAMDSVLNQTIKELVYYVGDNCSTDGTREIIREYAAKDNRVRPIYYDRNDGTGMGALRVFTSIARIRDDMEFDWFCVLDADDIYEPDFLEKMLSFELPRLILELNPEYTFYLRHYSAKADETVLYAIPK